METLNNSDALLRLFLRTIELNNKHPKQKISRTEFFIQSLGFFNENEIKKISKTDLAKIAYWVFLHDDEIPFNISNIILRGNKQKTVEEVISLSNEETMGVIEIEDVDGQIDLFKGDFFIDENGCVYNFEKTKLIHYRVCLQNETYQIEKNCKILGAHSFNRVETDGDSDDDGNYYPSYYYNRLTQLVLPLGLEIIEERALIGCGRLNYLVIPSTVTIIKHGNFSRHVPVISFDGRTKLESIPDYDTQVIIKAKDYEFYMQYFSRHKSVSIISVY